MTESTQRPVLDVLDRLNARVILRDSAPKSRLDRPGRRVRPSDGLGAEADRAGQASRLGRYVIVSSMGSNPDTAGDDTFSV
jgi:hypothetical protein